MGISERQLGLIKESAHLLVNEINMTGEEAVQLISKCINKELNRRNTTMEMLNISSKPERTSFIRAVVQHVGDAIQENPYWRTKHLGKSIENFYKALHDSWNRE
ncbi:hypothetical protein [Leptospira idonii]|uniref:Uncharacterized protein n=1 Tax=Leptospira idonii TaxID=1193500 RepID=A0A4R9LXS5_9LEPT|nr:hypothetical protein [Leptospira idonii]TGN18054.1 hypothetical protein EHS15_15655 [Leptospira idonii]